MRRTRQGGDEMLVNNLHTQDHPLYLMLANYWNEFPKLKQANEDLDIFNFNNRFGLQIIGPESWDYLGSIALLIEKDVKLNETIVVVYSTTDSYRQVYEAIGDSERVGYLSRFEIYEAVHRHEEDDRPLHQIKKRLKEADLVVVLGDAPDTVIQHIMLHTMGCLIRLGQESVFTTKGSPNEPIHYR